MTTERAINSAKKSRFIYASERRFVAENEASDSTQIECPIANFPPEEIDVPSQESPDNSEELWESYMYGCPMLVCPGLFRQRSSGTLNDYNCSNPDCPLQIQSVPYYIEVSELKQRIETEVYKHANTGCRSLLVPGRLYESTGERVCVACHCGFWGVVL